MKSVLQISRVTLQEWFSIDCEGLSCSQFFSLYQLKKKKEFSISILPVRHSIFFSPPFGSYFAVHDTDCILPRSAPVANYSRKVRFTNL